MPPWSVSSRRGGVCVNGAPISSQTSVRCAFRVGTFDSSHFEISEARFAQLAVKPRKSIRAATAGFKLLASSKELKRPCVRHVVTRRGSISARNVAIRAVAVGQGQLGPFANNAPIPAHRAGRVAKCGCDTNDMRAGRGICAGLASHRSLNPARTAVRKLSSTEG